jgi:zf-MYND-like zinc finger, mRNA-binding
MCCPKCGQLGRQTLFCTQECFTANWAQHSRLHAILLQNKQITERDTQKRKSDATSMAMAAIQDLMGRLPGSSGKAKKDEDAPLAVTVEKGENLHANGGGSPGWLWLLIGLMCLMSFWFLTTGNSKTPARPPMVQERDSEANKIRAEMKAMQEDVLRRFAGQDDTLKRLGVEFESLKHSLQASTATTPIQPSISAVGVPAPSDTPTEVSVIKIDPSVVVESVGQVRKENKTP